MTTTPTLHQMIAALPMRHDHDSKLCAVLAAIADRLEPATCPPTLKFHLCHDGVVCEYPGICCSRSIKGCNGSTDFVPEQPAASAAGSGGTGGSKSIAESSLPTTETNAATRTSSADTVPAPADRPAVPAWCEDGQIDVYFLSTKEINSGVAALRADRDYWRERAKHWKANHDDQVRIKRNLHEMYDQAYRLNSSLQAQCDKQLATITELREGINRAVSDFCDPFERLRDPAAEAFYKRWANPPEPPKSSWRERCKIRAMPAIGYWDIESEDGRWFWHKGPDRWKRQDPQSQRGCFRSDSDARQVLATIPTPPPGETA